MEKFIVAVDYARSIEEMVLLTGCYAADGYITTEHFPTNRSGKIELAIELFHFDRKIVSNDAIKEMGTQGYRPAELHELLALGATYPDLQCKFPIMALGAVCQFSDGRRAMACLGKDHIGRELYMYDFDADWLGAAFRFAAIRSI